MEAVIQFLSEKCEKIDRVIFNVFKDLDNRIYGNFAGLFNYLS